MSVAMIPVSNPLVVVRPRMWPEDTQDIKRWVMRAMDHRGGHHRLGEITSTYERANREACYLFHRVNNKSRIPSLVSWFLQEVTYD